MTRAGATHPVLDDLAKDGKVREPTAASSSAPSASAFSTNDQGDRNCSPQTYIVWGKGKAVGFSGLGRDICAAEKCPGRKFGEP
jgi:hypothetical protein